MITSFKRRHLMVAVLGAGAAAVMSRAMQPRDKLASELGQLHLASAIPAAFGPWRALEAPALVVNPQANTLVNKLYAETLSRSYRNSTDGYVVMLSLAYGVDQRESMAAHLPEACYPAQGFRVVDKRSATIALSSGHALPVQRLETRLGATRNEPVTYWAMIGTDLALDPLDQKLKALRYTLRGVIPDGLMFRVSSIDNTVDAAFSRQAEFIDQMLGAVTPDVRRRLAGF